MRKYNGKQAKNLYEEQASADEIDIFNKIESIKYSNDVNIAKAIQRNDLLKKLKKAERKRVGEYIKARTERAKTGLADDVDVSRLSMDEYIALYDNGRIIVKSGTIYLDNGNFYYENEIVPENFPC